MYDQDLYLQNIRSTVTGYSKQSVFLGRPPHQSNSSKNARRIHLTESRSHRYKNRTKLTVANQVRWLSRYMQIRLEIDAARSTQNWAAITDYAVLKQGRSVIEQSVAPSRSWSESMQIEL